MATSIAAPAAKPTSGISKYLAWSVDHKIIGIQYMVTSFTFFLIGGLLAELIRTELLTPVHGDGTNGVGLSLNDIQNQRYPFLLGVVFTHDFFDAEIQVALAGVRLVKLILVHLQFIFIDGKRQIAKLC